MNLRDKILLNAKEVLETTDIKEVAHFLKTNEWVAVDATYPMTEIGQEMDDSNIRFMLVRVKRTDICGENP